MAKKPKSLPPTGSTSAVEIYSIVGSALSYWEGAEDVLMGLFAMLCKENEPIAFAAYVQAPRKVRVSMLRLALETYQHRFIADELETVRQSMSQLDKLAQTRNEIAHGHVSNLTMNEQAGDGTNTIVATGNYLLPSLNEGQWHERTPRFHHTAQTIFQFQETVRDHRWAIIQAQTAMQMREQEAEAAAGGEVYMKRKVAVDIASRKIAPGELDNFMRPMAEWRRSSR